MSLSILAAAADSPGAEALVCDGVRLSFAALAERVRRRASELWALEVKRPDPRPVALVVDGSLTMFEYFHAALALGVPLLPIHPKLTPLERDALMQRANTRGLLDPSQAPPALSLPAETRAFPAVSDEWPLALVPSSGSTGSPKLVELSRRAFLALARADAARVPALASDRALLCLPLSHVGGLSVVIRALLARRCCVAFRAGAGGLMGSVPELAQMLCEERISLLSLVPAVLGRLLRDAPALLRQAPLRAVLVGGQACSAELLAEARSLGVPVLTSYGLTEMCSQVSTSAFPPPTELPVEQGVVSVGLPLAGVELRVVAGLIEVRGPSLFTRYVGGDSALNAQGYFETGDRGAFDPERGLFVFGRVSELIITGGENVDPTEVEHALLASGGSSAVCVFGVHDPEFGQRVAAAIEVADSAHLDEQGLFSRLDERLASFKQPRLVCHFETLPRLPSGKLDRRRICAEAGPRLRPAKRALRG